MRDPIGGAVDSITLKGQYCQGAPKPWWLRSYLLVPEPWLVLEARRKPTIESLVLG
jgi:hypothetical protein